MQCLPLYNLSAAGRYGSISLALLLAACGGSGDSDVGNTTANVSSEVSMVQDTSGNDAQVAKPPETGMAINASQDSTAADKKDSNALPSKLLATTSTSTCASSTWAAGKYYSAGSVVYYSKNGKYYRASHSNPGYDPTISTWYWTIYTCASIPTSTSTSTSTLVNGSETSVVSPVSPVSNKIVSEAQFNQMFPNRSSFYSYAGFAAAVNSYPDMFGLGSDVMRKQEAAAFLANVNHETGGLRYIREANQANWPLYCQSSSKYPCAPNQQYYGRGPIQLSWNYNYGAAGAALGLNLLADPDMVARDSKVAWKTAIWFWMTQRGAGLMTPHEAMVNLVGFAETIRSINGALECNKQSGSVGNTQMQTRVAYYRNFTSILAVPTGNNLTC